MNAASYWAPGANAVNSRYDHTSSTAHDTLPGLMLTDGDKMLIADESSTVRRFKLGASESQYVQFADKQGEVPFGGKIGYADSAAKAQSMSYYVLSVGFQGVGRPDGLHEQLLNVNIGDAMKMGNTKIADGHSHRGVFPIAPEKDAPLHWKWIDATVTVVGNKAGLAIHRISSSDTKPVNDSQWDNVNMQYALRHQANPQHLNATEFWTANTGKVLWKGLSSEYKNAYRPERYLIINENAK